MPHVEGVHQLPELCWRFWAGPLAQANLPEIFGLGQAAQGGVTLQLGLFFLLGMDFALWGSKSDARYPRGQGDTICLRGWGQVGQGWQGQLPLSGYAGMIWHHK